MRSVLIVFSLALAACASDPCGNQASAISQVASKEQSCVAQNPVFQGAPAPCLDQNACEEDLKSCSAADRTLLDEVANCYTSYAASSDCTFAALQQADQCASNATTLSDGGSRLSQGCAQAFVQNQGTCSLDAG